MARRSTGGKAPTCLARAAARRASSSKAGSEVASERRYHLGTIALRDFCTFHRSGELLIGKLPAERLSRVIAQEYTNAPRFQAYAFFALQ